MTAAPSRVPRGFKNVDQVVAEFGQEALDLMVEMAYEADPLADAVIAEQRGAPPEQRAALEQGIAHGLAGLDRPGPALAAFLKDAEETPHWVDQAALVRGAEALAELMFVILTCSLLPLNRVTTPNSELGSPWARLDAELHQLATTLWRRRARAASFTLFMRPSIVKNVQQKRSVLGVRARRRGSNVLSDLGSSPDGGGRSACRLSFSFSLFDAQPGARKDFHPS